jgi:predicted nucleic acid-binding protein
MRFGAAIAGWGSRRTSSMERIIGGSQMVPPLQEVITAYVDLRSWCVRSGHGLGGRTHEADRWVAAVALAGHLPLASDDGIFENVDGLQLVQP